MKSEWLGIYGNFSAAISNLSSNSFANSKTRWSRLDSLKNWDAQYKRIPMYLRIIHHQAILLDRMQFEKYVTDKNTDCVKYCAANAILRCMIINIYHWV